MTGFAGCFFAGKNCRVSCDVRATVVDADVVAVAIHSQERSISRVDCRRNNMQGMKYSLVDLPDSLARSLVRLTGSYGLHFAAIDLALDRTGRYWFLELNPAGQWAWLEQRTGLPLRRRLADLLLERNER